MSNEKEIYDCVIAGAGAAGLSAALTLGRARRRVLICGDGGAPRNAPARASHGFFTRDGASPFELLKIGREQLEPYETVEFRTTGIKDINESGGRFEVALVDGKVEKARKIILAFGVRDEFPDIAKFGEFWGKTVFHCPFCHGFEVRDQPLAVVGSGEAGVAMIALLKSWSADLALCTNGEAELSAAQRKLLDKHEVAVREKRIVRFEGANGRLETIVFEGGERLARSGALIRPKQILRSDLAERLGCELTDTGHIKVGDFNRTTLAGVYAAGDAASPMQTITATVAQGVLAAAGITHSLVEEDFA